MNELLLQVSCYNLLASAQAKCFPDYWNADCDLKSDIEKIKHAAGLLKRSAGDTVGWHVVKQTCPQEINSSI